MGKMIDKIRNKTLSTSAILVFGYLIVIVIGAILLSLPVASRQMQWTPFINSLFTSTSATCVTGLVVYDTYNYFSLFGQIVILILVQIGGIGFMSFWATFGLILRKRISLYERKLMLQANGNFSYSGTFQLVRKIALFTFSVEVIGAALLSIVFLPEYGIKSGIFKSIFISVTAFCNAGFDIMTGNFTSLTAYVHNPLVNLVVVGLVVIGGLGFLVWDDLVKERFRFKKLHLHSKIVLVSTAILLIAPMFLFMLFERSYTFKDFTFFESMLAGLFQSMTSRTAGYNTVDMASLSNPSVILTSILMFIGASPGSTAGGIKTTTFVVLVFSMIFANSESSQITIGKRRLEKNAVKQATSIASIYVSVILLASMVITAVNPEISFKDVFFETISAISTTGLSMGITPTLDFVSKCVLILLMYIGRVGALTILLFLSDKKEPLTKRPEEKILIG